MSAGPTEKATKPIRYPDSDGKPMADNTIQARWIMTLFGGLDTQFADRPDVFVAADHLWYPVEGKNKIRQAPDVYVVFGRPKRDRGSYMQWQEGNIPPTVVFEILSPGDRRKKIVAKHEFYEEYGVEEYYLYNPMKNRLRVFLRRGDVLVRAKGWTTEFVSPRLGIRFAFEEGNPEMTVYGANGKAFTTQRETNQALDAATERAAAEADRADAAALARAEAEARAAAAVARAARLVELGRKARRGTATPEEIAELERLEGEG